MCIFACLCICVCGGGWGGGGVLCGVNRWVRFLTCMSLWVVMHVPGVLCKNTKGVKQM